MAKITIFGLGGTGTTTAGRRLAEYFGYDFMSSGNMFRSQAKELGCDLYEFEQLCNTNPQYDKELDEMVADYGRTHDNFFFESRLAWYFIPDSIKIKFTCDFSERLKRIATRDGVSVEVAHEKTVFREQSGEKRYLDNYGIKELGPDNVFDLIIDTTHLPMEGVIAKIKDYLITEKGFKLL